jgi:hypothetical protein
MNTHLRALRRHISSRGGQQVPYTKDEGQGQVHVQVHKVEQRIDACSAAGAGVQMRCVAASKLRCTPVRAFKWGGRRQTGLKIGLCPVKTCPQSCQATQQPFDLCPSGRGGDSPVTSQYHIAVAVPRPRVQQEHSCSLKLPKWRAP